MKNLLYITIPVLIFLVISTQKAFSNNVATKYKVAVYISAYGEEVWAGQNLWTKRGIPQNWANSFDLSINLDEEVRILFNKRSDSQRMTVITDLPLIREVLVMRIRKEIAKLYADGTLPLDVKLVVIGHGVTGGLLTRQMASSASSLDLSEIRDPITNSVIARAEVSAITVATPHQGFPLILAASNNLRGNRNIEPVLSEFRVKMVDGLTTQTSWVLNFILNFLPWLGDLLGAIADLFNFLINLPTSPIYWLDVKSNLNWGEDLRGYRELRSEVEEAKVVVREEIPVLLDKALVTASSVIDAKTSFEDFAGYGLGDLLRPDWGNGAGTIINHINGTPNPAHYRSVIGEEKKYIPVRLASEIIVGDGNETDLIEQYDKLRRFTRAQRDSWNAEVRFADGVGFGIWNRGPRRRTRERREKWQTARETLDTIDRFWGKVIGAYTYSTVTSTRRVFVEVPCEFEQDLPAEHGFLNVEALMNFDEGEPDLPLTHCYEWRSEPHTYTVLTATKNDGLLSPEYAAWDTNGDPDDKVHNFTYGDGHGGGYNHLELVRYRRAYTQDNEAINTLARPMRETRTWLDNFVLQ